MYFSTINLREAGTTQVILPKPSLQRPIKPVSQQPTGNGVQTQQNQQQQSVQQTPQQPQQQQNNQTQQNQQQPAMANRLNAAALNKRQIPNGSKNTVNPLRQAQKPMQQNIRK